MPPAGEEGGASGLEDAHAAGVAIGSYPATKSGAQYTTKITVSSRDPEALAAATEAVRSAIDVSDAPLAS